jgi:hypothetical protein
MKATNHQPEQLSLSYCQTVALAVLRLKQQLQRECERAHPELREIIPAILDQEEKNAWNFSFFPHLLLPGLVEVRMAKLNAPGRRRSPSTDAKSAIIRSQLTKFPKMLGLEIGK